MQIQIIIPEIEEIRQQLKEILAYIQQKEVQKDEDELMNIKQAAKYLDSTPGTLYQNKTVPRFKKMGKVYFLKSQLKDWVMEDGNVKEVMQELQLTRNNKKKNKTKNCANWIELDCAINL